MPYVKGFQWTPERTAKLIELFEAGEPYHKIAAHFGCKEHQAQDKVYKLGLSSRTNRWEPEQVATLKRLRADGFTWSEIARQMGLRKSQVTSKAKHENMMQSREDARPTAYTPEPPPEPAVKSAVTGVCRVWAGGITFRRDQHGRLLFRLEDKAFAKLYGGVTL